MKNKKQGKLVMKLNEFYSNNQPPNTVILSVNLNRTYKTKTIGLYNQSKVEEEVVTGKLVRLGENQDMENADTLDITGAINLVALRGNRLGIYYDIKPTSEVSSATIYKFVEHGVALVLYHTLKDLTKNFSITKKIEVGGFKLVNDLGFSQGDYRITNIRSNPEIIIPPFGDFDLEDPIRERDLDLNLD